MLVLGMRLLCCVHVVCGVSRSPNCYLSTGTLVWRRHVHLPYPSHHAIRTTCTQLLPLMEMYCKWDMQEDCICLRDLMLWFDFEVELELHALGRSLLSMVGDDDGGFVSVPQPVTSIPNANPFDAFRHRLDAAASAICGLGLQVSLTPALFSRCAVLLQQGFQSRLSDFRIPYLQCCSFSDCHACPDFWIPCPMFYKTHQQIEFATGIHIVCHIILKFKIRVSHIAFRVSALFLCIYLPFLLPLSATARCMCRVTPHLHEPTTCSQWLL